MSEAWYNTHWKAEESEEFIAWWKEYYEVGANGLSPYNMSVTELEDY